MEYTAGTTGISLALVCAAKSYGLKIVYSDAFIEEKRLVMEAFGAEITDVRSENKKIAENRIKEMVEQLVRSVNNQATGTATSLVIMTGQPGTIH